MLWKIADMKTRELLNYCLNAYLVYNSHPNDVNQFIFILSPINGEPVHLNQPI